jgi:hypothetical protein
LGLLFDPPLFLPGVDRLEPEIKNCLQKWACGAAESEPWGVSAVENEMSIYCLKENAGFVQVFWALN